MNFPITKIAYAIKQKNLDPVLLVEDLLSRISKYDIEIRAYVELNPGALDEAKNHQISNELSLNGIAFSVKDLIDTKQIRTAYGAKAFEKHIPSKDATVITNIKRHGGMVLGKTNTHRYALGLETPPTKNPWDRERIPGGSSGGSAAAIAADLAIVALGTDTGGSIRIPAAMCGVTGLKPTYGKVSNRGVFPTSPSMDHVGPLCRFASDLPLLLEAMGYRISCKPMKGPLKVGIVQDVLHQAEKGVQSKVKKCFNILASENFVEFEEIDLPGFLELCWATETIDTFETARIHQRQFLDNPRQYQRTARGLIRAGLSVSNADLERAKKGRLRAHKEYATLMKKYQVITFPTLPRIAPKPEEIRNYSSNDFLPMVRPLEIFDLLGYPAISIPCGFVNGLPVGVHFASYSERDDLVVELATKYQSVTDWHTAVTGRYRGFLEHYRNV